MLFTEEEFKGHLEKITHERYENSPDQILKTIEKVEETLERNNELIVQNPSFEEVKNEIAKMKDAAPGEDEIRLGYIREAGDEMKKVRIERSSGCGKTPHTDGMIDRKLE